MHKLKFIKLFLGLLLIVSCIGMSEAEDIIKEKLQPWIIDQNNNFTDVNKIRDKIMKIIADHVVSTTNTTVCIHIPHLLKPAVCYDKPFPTINSTLINILKACSHTSVIPLKLLLSIKRKLYLVQKIILSKCLEFFSKKILIEDYSHFFFILNKLIHYPDYWLKWMSAKLLLKFISLLKRNNSTIVEVNADYVLKMWKPFSDNISGLAVYDNLDHIDLYKNESLSKLDETNFNTTLYIPNDYLDEIATNLSVEERINLHATIIVVSNTLMSSFMFGVRYPSVLAIAIWGMCVDNGLPIIVVAGNRFVRRREFKLSDAEIHDCAVTFCKELSFLIFPFVTYGYCPSSVSNISSSIIWPKTPHGRMCYPRRICINKNFFIPAIHCSSEGPSEYGVDNQMICPEGLPSYTLQLYERLKCCSRSDFYCVNGNFIHQPRSYIDVKILLLYLYFRSDTTDYPLVTKLDLIDKGLGFLKSETQPFDLFNVVLALFETINGYPRVNLRKKNFIFASTGPNAFPFAGFSLHKNPDNSKIGYHYDVEYLPFGITTSNLSNNNNIEAAVYVQDVDQKVCMTVNFITSNYELARNLSFVCKSTIIIINTDCLKSLRVSFYLQVLYDPDKFNMFSSERYSFTLEIKIGERWLICIAESKENICLANKNITTYLQHSDIGKSGVHIPNKIVRRLNVLSQLATSMNPRAKRTYLKHLHILQKISYIGSGLSSIGIFCILLSTIFLKNWFTTRFNTTQLTLTLTIEIIFLFIDQDSIKHVGYLIFFYSILAQFAWMLIIGYQQYHHFIKVFNKSSISKKNSLLLGWVSPALIMLIPSILYRECFQCNICYKNFSIFRHFVMIPICCVIVINFIVYMGVMYNTSKEKRAEMTPKAKKARIRAMIIFPFLLGLSWASVFAMIIPSLWISVIGSYVFHIVTPSQGFILFIFAVLLDEKTNQQWREKFMALFNQRNE